MKEMPVKVFSWKASKSCQKIAVLTKNLPSSHEVLSPNSQASTNSAGKLVSGPRTVCAQPNTALNGGFGSGSAQVPGDTIEPFWSENERSRLKPPAL